ncbi:trypsin-like serine protease [Candidatus Dependentiae bacterium]|nr:MAG: trypsin-like serine protease [Candidatus Dependentiae bacterium]
MTRAQKRNSPRLPKRPLLAIGITLACLIIMFFAYYGFNQRIQRSGIWAPIQQRANNAAVQIVSQVGEFNWLQPYDIRQEVEIHGSGFFINAEGEIITNAHVVEEAKRIWIHLLSLGKKPINVDILSIAPERDIALLRVKQEDKEVLKKILGTIPYLPLGNSDEVRRTDNVLILGYPLGQQHLKSATGIISGREFLEGQSFIQTTAPINPGNSGGPLLNRKGRVIGINTAAVTKAQNVGYSIPINELKLIFDELHKKPFIRKPFFGFAFNNSSDFQATFLGNPKPGGLYINKIFKNSLAEKIGLTEGDMIYIFNGFTIDVFGEATVPWSPDKAPIIDLISRLKFGKIIPITIYRKSARKELSLEFKESPIYPIRTMYPDYEKIEYEIIGGMVVMQLTDNHLPLLKNKNPYLVRFEKIENKIEPVLVVTHILHGSAIQQLRSLKVGDIITDINGKEVKTLETFRTALYEGVTSNSLQIKTADNIFVVLPLRKILEDEKQLSKQFGYPISLTVKALLEKM